MMAQIMPQHKSNISAVSFSNTNAELFKAESLRQPSQSNASRATERKDTIEMVNPGPNGNTTAQSRSSVPCSSPATCVNSGVTSSTTDHEQILEVLYTKFHQLERQLSSATESSTTWEMTTRDHEEQKEQAAMDQSHGIIRLFSPRRNSSVTKRELEVAKQMVGTLSYEKDALKKQILERDETLMRIKREAEHSIESLTIELSRLSEKDKQRESQLNQLLDKVTSDKVDGRWNAPQDSVIRHKFNNLNNDIRNWAKVNGSNSFDIDTVSNVQFYRFLSGFVLVQEDAIPGLLAQSTSNWRGRLGSFLLHAALSHTVHSKIFNNPLFITGAADTDTMNAIFHELMKSDQKEAHIWRTTLWRLLAPPNHAQTPEALLVAEKTKKRTMKSCQDIARDFTQSQAQHLFAEVSTSDIGGRGPELTHIMESAANIAHALYTQHSSLRVLDLEYFTANNIVFNVQNPFLEGHPLSHVDVDDASRDGERIIAVTRPAILAFENDDIFAIERDRFRVLQKATVLLEGKVGNESTNPASDQACRIP